MFVQLLARGLINPLLPNITGNSTGGSALGAIISGVVGLLFIVAFIISFFYLLTGGVSWITSSGDKASLESARNKIIHALLGLVIVGASWAIASLVANFFCWDLTSLPIPVIGGNTSTTCN